MSGDSVLSEGALIVLQEIPLFIVEWGYPPTLRDLGERLGITATGVKHHLDVMRVRGLVDWEDGMARTLRVTDVGEEVSRG